MIFRRIEFLTEISVLSIISPFKENKVLFQEIRYSKNKKLSRSTMFTSSFFNESPN